MHGFHIVYEDLKHFFGLNIVVVMEFVWLTVIGCWLQCLANKINVNT